MLSTTIRLDGCESEDTVKANFTPLEQAALAAICDRCQDQGEILARQLATARLTRRQNSGAGFFTYLNVDRTHAPLPGSERVIGIVSARIDGFEKPVLLMLFLEGGYADMLEGATLGDGTVGVDLWSLKFAIEAH